jgi:hypothetical protein
MDYGRGRKTHRPRAIPGWRLKTDFDGRAVNDAATSETLGLPLEEARVLLVNATRDRGGQIRLLLTDQSVINILSLDDREPSHYRSLLSECGDI